MRAERLLDVLNGFYGCEQNFREHPVCPLRSKASTRPGRPPLRSHHIGRRNGKDYVAIEIIKTDILLVSGSLNIL